MGMFNFPVPGSGVCLEGFFGSKAAMQLDAESYSLPDWACFHCAPGMFETRACFHFAFRAFRAMEVIS